MRLIIDGRRLGSNRTGVGRYLEGLLEEWAEIGPPGDETIVVLHDPAGEASIPAFGGLKSVVVGRGWPGLAWERWGLGRTLRRDDLLFAPTNLIPGNWRGRTVLVAFDTLPYSLPDAFPGRVRWWFGPRYRRAARRADRVIVPSMATAIDVERHYGVEQGRIRVIRPAPGPDFRPTSTDPASSGPGRYFLFLGKRSRRRNIPATLEGFARFRSAHPDYRLVFVGPGDLQGELGPDLAERGVIDAGHQPDESLPSWISGAVALVYLSDYEGFGLPIVEAMACGCPVVTLRNSALTEAGGEAATYLDSADPESIRAAMTRLANDPAYRQSRIALGLEWVGRWSRRQFAEAVKSELIEVARS